MKAFQDASDMNMMWFMKAWNVVGGIGKSHWHYQELKGAIACLESCLPLMAHCDANIVVASTEVKFGVDHCAAQLIKEIGNKWNQVEILLSNLVEVLEVHTESQGAILLLIKEDGCTTW